jgi:hypothetical protein
VIGTSVDGYDIRGPGMQMRIRIGAEGKMTYMRTNLKRLELYGTYPLKPLAQALAEGQAGSDTLNLEPEVVNPTVTSMKILYNSHSSERSNELLLPVYAFMGPDCMIYVPAVNQQ